MNAAPKPGENILLFNGATTKIEIESRPEYSLPTREALTVSAWIRPDALEFPRQEGTNYVHWMGKGEARMQEWACRMYSFTTTDTPKPRPNRTSFYVFNPGPGRGTGSFTQEPVAACSWIHIVGVADVGCTHLFKNGQFKDCDIYRASDATQCVGHDGSGSCDPSGDPVEPLAGDAPLRIGTRDGASYFLGSIARVRIWGRVLSDDEIRGLYESDIVPHRSELVAEFLMNEGAGSDAMDTSPIGNDGVILDGVWAVE